MVIDEKFPMFHRHSRKHRERAAMPAPLRQKDEIGGKVV